MCVSGYMDIRRITKASDQQLNKLFESKITSTTANLIELVFIDYTGQKMRIVNKVKVKHSFDKHCLIEFPPNKSSSRPNGSRYCRTMEFKTTIFIHIIRMINT